MQEAEPLWGRQVVEALLPHAHWDGELEKDVG
jgi:hypothetical protein